MSRGYYTLTRVTDYGPYVTKVILPVPGSAKAEETLPEKFSVYVERMDEKGDALLLPKSWMARDDREPSRGYIPVLAAYPSDIEGNRADAGEFVTLETAYGPMTQLSSRISAPNGLNVYVKMRYTVTQTAKLESDAGALGGLCWDYPLGDFCPDAEGFLNSTSSYEPEPLNYGYFVPQTPGEKHPLIVWLHGAGEGGVDATIAYTANKVTAFAGEKIQKFFGGAFVLVPQTKTFWMNDGSGQYGQSGKSMYVEALKACIDEFVEKNPAIDRGRIYIGGDSNGGFMTMRMILDYPDFFAAAFPVCEALYDGTITDEALAKIVHLPIWFTHAKNDPVVKPETTVEATYRRLIDAGAKNVHFTFWPKIEDIHEGFRGPDGKPFEYLGHFAWIPVFNDDCRTDYDGKPVTVDGKEVSLLEWLSMQTK